jgi:GDPmannose 4,6-dehydratase
MKKAIIFGITGQDGSYLAELLIHKGYEVVGVTRRVSVNTLGRIEHILPQLTIVEGDITDGFNISKIIEDHKPDEIYNLAAQSHVGTSFKQPNLTWDITAGGVLNI